ncbi:hypothetical protein [Streptomyces massasporeus]|uniref:hypothetical protein n=1 Tax=Streptomyces massasporeus TaxID=67324 RepID=UPI0033E2C709
MTPSRACANGHANSPSATAAAPPASAHRRVTTFAVRRQKGLPCPIRTRRQAVLAPKTVDAEALDRLARERPTGFFVA